MTKTYELSNERMIMADVDEEHHMATVSVYVLDDLVKEANKADVLEQIRDEIEETIESYVCDKEENTMKAQGMLNAMRMTFEIIDNYKEHTE